MGRPEGSKYTIEELPEGWHSTVLDLMKGGGTIKQAYTKLNLNSYGHGVLMREDIYKEIFEEGRQLAEVYWEQYAEKAARSEVKCDRSILIFLLKNRLGWRDVKEKEKPNTKDKTSEKALRAQYSLDKGEDKNDTLN